MEFLQSLYYLFFVKIELAKGLIVIGLIGVVPIYDAIKFAKALGRKADEIFPKDDNLRTMQGFLLAKRERFREPDFLEFRKFYFARFGPLMLRLMIYVALAGVIANI